MSKHTLKCVRACQVPGYGIVRKDAVIALDEDEIDDRIRSCFVDAETGTPVTARRSKGLEDMTKDELQFRAEQLGVQFGTRMAKAELINLIRTAEADITERA